MEKLDLKKPREYVEISNTMSVVQRKAFNALMMQAILIPKRKGQRYHQIDIKELCHLTGYRQKDFIYLDKQLEEMQQTLISWSNSSGTKRGRVQFLGHVWYDLDTGILEFSFSEKLVDLVKKNRIFNRLDMGSMKTLVSKYSVALYELCAGYRETQDYENGTGWRHLEDMKVFLCGDSNAYPEFKIFNRDVLKVAIKEVNEKTDIKVTLETRRHGRQVSALRFIVEKNEGYEDIKLKRPKRIEVPQFGSNIDAKQKASEEFYDSPEEMVDFFNNYKPPKKKK